MQDHKTERLMTRVAVLFIGVSALLLLALLSPFVVQ